MRFPTTEEMLNEVNRQRRADRAARIRVLAERATERYEGTNSSVPWRVDLAFDWARGVIDELDRLEAAEREKEVAGG